MDVTLFSNMLKELLSYNDAVGVPGLGTFEAVDMPSVFSDRGYTLNPPYRKIAFRPGEVQDTVLTDFYAETNSVSKDKASLVIASFVRDIKSRLADSRMVGLPLFGVFRLLRDGSVLFVPDENLSIFPHLDILEPVSLRQNHTLTSVQPIEQSEPQSAVQPETQQSGQPVDGPAKQSGGQQECWPIEQSEPQPAVHPEGQQTRQPEPQPACQSGDRRTNEPVAFVQPAELATPAPAPRKKLSGLWVLLIVIAVIAVVALAALYVLGRMRPDLVDPLLFTEEQLQILRYA